MVDVTFKPFVWEDGHQFGPWRYDAKAKTLTLWQDKRWVYEVDLDRCTKAFGGYEWIRHLAEKRGGPWTAEALGHLVRAFYDINKLPFIPGADL